MDLFNRGYGIVGHICELIVLVSCVGIMVLAGIWCLYFLSRVRELGRKIHYLKKQTEERCYEELTNAKVDYIKSIFIAAICAFEVIEFVNVVPLAGAIDLSIDSLNSSYISVHNHIFHNCTGLNKLLESSSSSYFVRGLLAMTVSAVIIYTSLIHILTSYLSHAYAVKRVISLARRDKVLLIWLLIQLIVLWISVAYWRAFLFVVILELTVLFPIHLYLYIKYSRSLYLLLKRRRLDAWFEDPQSHKRLVGMCKEYKRGSILYVVSIVLLDLSFIGVMLPQIIDMFFNEYSQLNCVFFNRNSPLFGQIDREYSGTYELSKKIFLILANLFTAASYFFFFLLHFSIAYQAVKRVVKRRRDYNSYTGTRSHPIYQPLIGTN